ncbi:MAG: hypothetical protein WC872_00175 [Candidatus Absconditabacterales bacterium]
MIGVTNAAVSTNFNTQDNNYNPTVPGSTSMAQDSLIKTIKNFINRVLGILALIALIILLRGGFQMVTAAGSDEKYKKGFKILQQAAVGLAFVALSWLVVSLIFYVIGLITT